MVTPWLYAGLVGLVALERLHELRISRRNAALAIAAGGREYGRGHWRAMQALHTAFLVAAPLEVFFLDRPLRLALAAPAFLLLTASMALRYWIIHVLGARWNTRVIVVPGWTPSTEGPYRWIRHPNYLAVVAEFLALPLVHGAWLTALVGSLLNAAVLRARLRAEEAALDAWPGYREALAGRGRFVPRPGAAPGGEA